MTTMPQSDISLAGQAFALSLAGIDQITARPQTN
jgi:hypothetical protein